MRRLSAGVLCAFGGAGRTVEATVLNSHSIVCVSPPAGSGDEPASNATDELASRKAVTSASESGATGFVDAPNEPPDAPWPPPGTLLDGRPTPDDEGPSPPRPPGGAEYTEDERSGGGGEGHGAPPVPARARRAGGGARA